MSRQTSLMELPRYPPVPEVFTAHVTRYLKITSSYNSQFPSTVELSALL